MLFQNKIILQPITEVIDILKFNASAATSLCKKSFHSTKMDASVESFDHITYFHELFDEALWSLRHLRRHFAFTCQKWI